MQLKVKKLLEQNDYVIKANGVTAIQIPDEAGSLNSILKLLGQNGRNVEYMYGLSIDGASASIVLKISDTEKAKALLTANGIDTLSLLSKKALYPNTSK